MIAGKFDKPIKIKFFAKPIKIKVTDFHADFISCYACI